jgi:hypothetical protein
MLQSSGNSPTKRHRTPQRVQVGVAVTGYKHDTPAEVLRYSVGL